MIRILLCDDNKVISNQLEQLLDIYSFQHQVDFNITIYQTLDDLTANMHAFDLIFLDIHFQDDTSTGYDVAKKLRKIGITSQIIFLTSLPRYASRGYEVDAFRFLTKPIDPEKLKEAMDAFIAALNPNQNYIMIKSTVGQAIVDTNKLILVETVQRKRQLILTDRIIITWESLQNIYSKLSQIHFAIPHQSYIVNYRFITNISGNSITMQNSQIINISRQNVHSFMTGLHRIVEKAL